jgi:PIN domain nuclease of toxin-antitoxin system
MKYLLDTHAILWYFEDSKELPTKIYDIIDNPEAEIYVSSVSLWEIAIKISISKLELSMALDELLDIIKIRDFNVIHIENEYLTTLSKLPFIHKDPFDRLIVSSAITEKLTIITVDDNIQKYDVSWIW